MENVEKGYWREFLPLWWQDVRSWYSIESKKQAVTTLVGTVAPIWLVIEFYDVEIAVDNIIQLMFAVLAGLAWFIFVSREGCMENPNTNFFRLNPIFIVPQNTHKWEIFQMEHTMITCLIG